MTNTQTWNTYFNSNAGITDRLWQQETFARLVKNYPGNRALQVGFTDTETLNACPITMRVLACDSVRFINHDTRVPVLATDTELPFESDCFDLITWPHGLDATENAEESLAEIARVLAPNGVLLTTFFNRTGAWNFMQKLGFKSPLPCPGFTVTQARTMVANAGLTYMGGNYGVYAINRHPERCDRLKLDLAGDRWWPTLGNMIMLSARKMDSTMTLVGKINFARPTAGLRSVFSGSAQKTEKL